MSEFNEYVFEGLIYNFLIAEKIILRKNTSQNESKKETRKINITKAYNETVKYSKIAFNTNDTTLRKNTREKIIAIRDKLINALGILGYKVKAPDKFIRRNTDRKYNCNEVRRENYKNDGQFCVHE